MATKSLRIEDVSVVEMGRAWHSSVLPDSAAGIDTLAGPDGATFVSWIKAKNAAKATDAVSAVYIPRTGTFEALTWPMQRAAWAGLRIDTVPAANRVVLSSGASRPFLPPELFEHKVRARKRKRAMVRSVHTKASDKAPASTPAGRARSALSRRSVRSGLDAFKRAENTIDQGVVVEPPNVRAPDTRVLWIPQNISEVFAEHLRAHNCISEEMVPRATRVLEAALETTQHLAAAVLCDLPFSKLARTAAGTAPGAQG